MKKIAIVTGATGGLGREFVKLLTSEQLDEVWAIARNTEKLHLLQKEFGNKIIPISKDLSNSQEITSIGLLLAKENPEVKYLINNAGAGRMGYFDDFTTDEINNTIMINCSTVATLCTVALPFMKKGSNIMNLSSQASFQPDPYLSLYAATKAFVTSYSRALNCELKEKGITVTAVCPGWVNTELLMQEWNGRKIKFPGIVEPEPVARQALRDAKRGKDMSVYSSYVKWMQLFSKMMPHKMVMKLWVKSIDKINSK